MTSNTDRQTRIVHLLPYFYIGGRENGILNIANRLDQGQFKSYIYSFVATEMAELVDSNVKLRSFGSSLGNDWRLPFALARAMQNDRIDIVHTHSWSTLVEGIMAAKIAGIPFIIHGEHGTIEESTKLNVYVQRSLWRVANKVLSVSEILADRLGDRISFPRDRIEVVINGVDSQKFRVLEPRPHVQQIFGVPSGSRVIGSVGRLVPVKDYPVLIEAMSILAPQFPELHLTFSGYGKLEEPLKAQAHELGLAERTHFLGKRLDIPEILNALDVFILCSESEGMSNTILEAMSCARPIVATRVGGNPELVADGKTGLLVPPKDPQALASAISRFLRDPALQNRLGSNARARVESYFSLDAMIRAYERVYLEVGHGCTNGRI